MKFFLIMLKVRMKQVFSKKSYIIVMSILPILIWLIIGYGNKYIEEICIKAGIYREGETAILIANMLMQNQDIKFDIYDTKEELEKAVAKREVECGFILDNRLDKSFDTGDFKESITVIKSQATMSKGVLQETVVASVYELISSEITYKFLIEKQYVEDNINLKKWIEERKKMYYESGKLMEMEFINTANENIEVKSTIVPETLKLSKGILAVFMMIASIMMGINIIDEKKEISTIKTELAIIGAYWLIEIIISMICMGIINIYVGSLEFYINEFIKLLIYLLSINSIIILVSSVCKDSYVLNSVLPTAILATVIFCPIIIDITSMGVGIKYISYLILPYHYLSGEGNIIILLLVSLISLFATVCVVKKRYR